MLLDLIDLSKLRRAIVYALTLAIVFAVQDLLAARVPLWGVRPMMIPAAVVAIGLYEGGLWGGFLGLAAGFFFDMGYIEQTVLFTVLLAVIGFFAGVLGKYLLHKGFLSFMVLVLAAMVLITGAQMIPFLFFTDTRDAIVWKTGVIQIFWSLPWAIPVYFPCRAIAARPMGK